jgi:outer membrane receptor protein involved in Fe transport
MSRSLACAIASVVLVLPILTVMPARLAAQAATAAVLGTITDQSGAAVPGVAVDVKNTATGVSQTAISDSRGRYRVPNLPIGPYEVKAELQGFQTAIHKDVEVAVGSERVVDFTLSVGQVSESVTVSQQVPLVETTSSQLSNLVDQTQIRELPLNGRNLEQLILLAPGVSIYQSIFAGAFYGAAPAYSVSGSRPNGQAQLLDGTNIQDYFNRGSGAGVIGTSMGVDAIAEFQVLTNTYSAQYGGNGSVMNAVSKSGSNRFSGSAFEFLRNSKMDAKNFFDRKDRPIPPFRRDQFGFSLGGPVKRDRMFFFVNYEGLTQSLTQTRIITVPDANARQGLLPTGPGGSLVNVGVDPRVQPYFKFWPLPDTVIGGGLGNASLTPTQTAHENYVLGRFDWTPRNGVTLFARYVSDVAELFEPTGGPIPDLWPTLNSNNNQFATVEERHVLSNSRLNLVRAAFSRPWQRSRTDINVHPELQWFPNEGLPDGGLTIGGGVTGLGSAAPGPWQFSQSRFNVSDDFYWTLGAHSLKFGGGATKVHSDVFSPIPGHGSFTFSSLTLFLQGVPLQYSGTQRGGRDATRNFREWLYDLYAQDDWQLSGTLTLNLGLRYSPTNNGTEANDKLHRIIDPPVSTGFEAVPHIYDHNPSLANLDPRIGVAWDPRADHRTSIRGGFGVYHAIIGPRDYAATYYNSPPFVTAVELNPVFPFPLSAVAPALPTQTFAMDVKNDLHTPYVQQWNVNLQQQLPRNTVVTAAYVGSRSRDQVQQIQLNPPTPISTPNGLQFATLQTVNGRLTVVDNPRINPAYDNLSSARTIGWANYHALQLGLNRRFANNWSGQVSYTYSKCRDIGSGSFLVDGGTTLSNPFNPDDDEGACSYDLRHNLTLNGLYILPFKGNPLVEGWQLSGVLLMHSGNPFTVTTGIANNTFRGSAPRPNLVPGCDPLAKSTVDHWFNAACFTLPDVGFNGTFPRNELTGPPLRNVDAALMKTTRLSGDRSIQFRLEVFNLLNRANLSLPNGAAFSQAAIAGTGVINPNAGRITSTRTTARQIQLGFRFTF